MLMRSPKTAQHMTNRYSSDMAKRPHSVAGAAACTFESGLAYDQGGNGGAGRHVADARGQDLTKTDRISPESAPGLGLRHCGHCSLLCPRWRR